MDPMYDVTVVFLLSFSLAFAVNVDIMPHSEAVVNEGEEYQIICKNLEPADNWVSLTYQFLEVTIATSFRTITPCNFSVRSDTILGKLSLSCNFNVFILTVFKASFDTNNRDIACKIFVNQSTTRINSTKIKIKEPLNGPYVTPNDKQTIEERTPRTFHCTARSFPPSNISWYINNRRVLPTSLSKDFNFSSSSLTYSASRDDNSQYLYCTAFNEYDSANSSMVMLDITYLPQVTIIPNNTKYSIINGTDSLTLGCHVSEANPTVTNYFWYKIGTMQPISTQVNITFSGVSVLDDGRYLCKAGNTVGMSNSSEIKVDVLYGVNFEKITIQQPHQGDRLQVKCTVYSNPSIKESDIQWTKKDNLSFKQIGQLVINNIGKEDSGIYICSVTLTLKPTVGESIDVAGQTTVEVDVLYLPKVTIIPNYTKYSVLNGTDSLTFGCFVSEANPTVTNFLWYKTGTIQPISTRENITFPGGIMVADDGRYFCSAKNTVGVATSSEITVDVLYGVNFEKIPIQHPHQGDRLQVKCTVYSNPSITESDIKWTKKDNLSFKQIGQLVINNIGKGDSGIYICSVTLTLKPTVGESIDVAGQTTVEVDVLYVPEIHIEPQHNPFVLYEGQEDIVLTCEVDDANPNNDIAYLWHTQDGNVTKRILNINVVTKKHHGEYTCTANNSAGSSRTAKRQIEVQYVAVISDITDFNIGEGESIIVVPTIDAKPDPESVWWTRESDSFRIDDTNLTLSSIRRKFSGQYICHVKNTLTPTDEPSRTNVTTKAIFVNVQYPPSLVIAESTYHTVVENDTLSLHCSVQDANPNVSKIEWYKHNSKEPIKKPNLTINRIGREQAGNYSCHAKNAIGDDIQYVYVDVLYVPSIVLLRNLNGSMVDENTTVVIQCEIDSNPKSDVEWNLNNNISTGIVTGSRSYYTIVSANCYDTGTVYCTASNKLISDTFTATNMIPLYVTCAPRLDKYMQQPEDKIGLPIGGTLNLTVFMIAYPEPSKVVWKFRQNITSNGVEIALNGTRSDVFKHVAYLSMTNLTEFEFGFYTLAMENGFGSSLTTFEVVPKGPPEPSIIVNTSCNVLQATVVWMTAFNGGQTQQFYLIVYTENEEYQIVKTSVFSDKKEEVKFKTFTLRAGHYSFRIVGKNQFGNASSLPYKKACTVKDILQTKNASVIAAATGGGIGSAVVLIGIIAMTLFIVRKRRMLGGKHHDDGRKNLTLKTTEEEEEDGLTENVLYESAGDNLKANPGSSRDVYAIVQKSNGTKDESEKIQETSLYAEIQKKTVQSNKGKAQTNSGTKTTGKLNKKGKREEQKERHDDVYENVTEKKTEKVPNIKNKDGLVYADLVFKNDGKRRFIIRGIENKTNYADIDLALKADPLPSDESDKEEENDGNEKK